jgi:hypothetical protein
MLDYGSMSAFKALGQSQVGNTSSCPVPFHGALLTVSSNASSAARTADMCASNPQARLYWNYIQDQFG